MPAPMRQPRLHGRQGLVFPLLVSLLLLPLLRSGAASTLATFAMAKADATTIVCGLVPSVASPLLVDLNCTTAGGDHERQETYPSTHPFSALAGGEDFLCAVGPSSARADAVDMRWWDLSKNGTEGGGGGERSKRVYLGPPIRALASSGYRVCGVLDGGELHCWRWRGLAIPAGLRFVAVAVGKGFVCGIVAGPPTPIRCFGNDTEMEAVRGAPRGGSYDVVAACGRRACALSTGGGLSCWGTGAPALNGENATSGYAALALGESGVCGLRTNGTIRCFGDGVAAPPGTLAGSQYIDVQAQGSEFCGVLMANYSLVCWGGGGEFNATNRLVFDRVLPGPCVLMSSCQCGVLPGSANLCAGGRCICVDCAFELNVASPKAALPPGKTSSSRRKIIWIAVAAAAFLVLVVALQFALLLWCRRRRRRKNGLNEQDTLQGLMPPRLGSSRSKGPGSVVEHFTLDVLHAATEGFADSHRIGSGSFGSVYRGTLPDGRVVAIKRAEDQATKSSSSAARPARRRDRETAFNSELIALARANHKNIVCLLGCCAESGERVLVYEFMINGTLHDQLHDRSPMAPPVLSWRGRLTIALDAARGIEYMHVYAVPPIIHRDIKSANILLDDSWTAKIADFGLSSVLEPGAAAGECGGDEGDGSNIPQQPLYTGGTVGYMDPEYYRLQHLTDKSDVYSFGVVLLELMSGCRVVQRYAESVTPKNVVEFTVPHILADDVARVLDPRLTAPTPHEAEALAYVGYLAADCVGPIGCDRPSMTEVVDALERALANCPTAPVSRSGTARRVLSRSGTDQFDLTDTD